MRPWYFDNLLDYFAGVGIVMILSGDPDPSMGGDPPDEGANEVTGDQGFTYIPEPSAIALLALGVLAVTRRRRVGCGRANALLR